MSLSPSSRTHYSDHYHDIDTQWSVGIHLNTGYVLQTDTGSLYLAVNSTHTAIGFFRLLVQRSGTHCQMNSKKR